MASTNIQLKGYKSPLIQFLETSTGELTPVTSTRVAKAREKLKKLTKIQFSDLSTDVYDEMKRRELVSNDPNNASLPKFLASQTNYHPKRNQARQKLAALPPSRFKDLVNDVLFEIDNRIPTNDTMRNPNNLQINVEKSNLYHANNNNNSSNSPITPSQREIKPTTLVPQKSELTWSSDDEDNDDHSINNKRKSLNNFNHAINNKNNIDEEVSEINRSPSKRDTIATNEVLNEHALPHVKFPVDGEVDDDDEYINMQNQNDHTNINGSNNDKEIEELKLVNMQLTQQLNGLKDSFDNQLDELNNLKQMTDIDHEKQLSVEDSREFDNLKNYLDRVLEENEELKSKLATSNNNDTTLNHELENLKQEHGDLINVHEDLSAKYENLLKSHDELSSNFKTLQDKSVELNKQNDSYEKKLLSYIPPITPTANTTFTSIKPNTSALLEWQNKFENLRSNQILDNLTDLSLNIKSIDKKLFASNGLISVDKISNVYASLETILIYLDSQNGKNSDSNVNPNEIDPSILFQRVAILVGHANELSKSIQLKNNDTTSNRLIIRIDEKKRILTNSISNALSTTKHFVLYRSVLPKLVLNAAINDIYFAICDLISLVKIKNDKLETFPISEDKKEDPSLTPICFNKVRTLENESSPFKQASPQVRPLRITQRLASNPVISVVSDLPKPPQSSSQINNKGTHSPTSKIFNSPILPVVVSTNNDDTHNNNNNNNQTQHKGQSLKIGNASKNANESINNLANRSITSLGNESVITLPNGSTTELGNETVNKSMNGSIGHLNNGSTSSVNNGSTKHLSNGSINHVSNGSINHVSNGSTNQLTGGSIIHLANESATNLTNDSVPNLVKESANILNGVADKTNKSTVLVSSLKSKFASIDSSDDNLQKSPNQTIDSNISNISKPSPIRGKNILDKMKSFENVEDNKLASPTKIPVKSNVNTKSFGKVIPKRDSTDLNDFKSNNNIVDEESNILKSNNITEKAPVVAKNIVTSISEPAEESEAPLKLGNIENSSFEKESLSSLKVENTNDEDFNNYDNNQISNKYEDATLDQKVNVASQLDSNLTEKRLDEPFMRNVEPRSNSDAPLVLRRSTNESEEDTDYSSDDDNKQRKVDMLDEQSEEPVKSYGYHESRNENIDEPIHDVPSTMRENISDNHSEPVSVKKEILQKDDIGDDKTVYEDFNNYKNDNDSNIGLDPETSALEIDEKLVKRVSRRESRRLSKKDASEMKQPIAVSDIRNNYNQNNNDDDKRISNDDLSSENDKLHSQHARGWEYDGESEEEEEEEFDIDNFNTLNPDNTLRELLLYLEHQTVEVIGAIQKTLESIRDPEATKGSLRSRANDINKVVKQMAEGTTTLMKQSRYVETMGHAKYVVGVLEDCVNRMEKLYGNTSEKDDDPANKNFKQRSAGIAFDVARSTKELVKTVEEATLRDEIAVLDSKLRGDKF